MDEIVLPLFPLNVVLFPGSALPLHIFEPRYRQLIRECLDKRWPEFGVSFLDKDKVSVVGCTAVVREVLQRYADGRCDIVVEGRQRYKIHRVDDASAPYALGHLSFLDDEPGTVDRNLQEETIGLYYTLLDAVYAGRPPSSTIGPNPSSVSFVIAQKAGMSLHQRQQLLETRSENHRLHLLHEYLKEELPKIQEAQEVQRIIHNDGYILP